VIDASSQPWGSDGIATGGSYLDIVGFEVKNASRIGINVWGGHNIRILSNRVHGNRDAAIFMGYDRRGVVRNMLVQGNDVYDNARVNAGVQGAHPGIVLAMRASYVSVRGNRVHQNYGEGIDMVMTDHASITGNQVWDNYAAEIYLDNATDSWVSGNLVYATGDRRFFWMNAPPSGIHVANEFYDVHLPQGRNVITNNIVVGGHWGFYYGAYQRGGGLRSTLVANNTFYAATDRVLHIDADAGHTASAIRNNIFRQVGSAGLASVPKTAGIAYSHNAWYGGTGVAGYGDVRADCRFAVPGGRTLASYALRAGSPCADRAVTLRQVPRDISWGLRGARPDLGAVESRR
jgi:parallel beta-helix repeat protein